MLKIHRELHRLDNGLINGEENTVHIKPSDESSFKEIIMSQSSSVCTVDVSSPRFLVFVLPLLHNDGLFHIHSQQQPPNTSALTSASHLRTNNDKTNRFCVTYVRWQTPAWETLWFVTSVQDANTNKFKVNNLLFDLISFCQLVYHVAFIFLVLSFIQKSTFSLYFFPRVD